MLMITIIILINILICAFYNSVPRRCKSAVRAIIFTLMTLAGSTVHTQRRKTSTPEPVAYPGEDSGERICLERTTKDPLTIHEDCRTHRRPGTMPWAEAGVHVRLGAKGYITVTASGLTASIYSPFRHVPASPELHLDGIIFCPVIVDPR